MRDLLAGIGGNGRKLEQSVVREILSHEDSWSFLPYWVHVALGKVNPPGYVRVCFERWREDWALEHRRAIRDAKVEGARQDQQDADEAICAMSDEEIVDLASRARKASVKNIWVQHIDLSRVRRDHQIWARVRLELWLFLEDYEEDGTVPTDSG